MFNKKECVAMLLAGGQGSRLYALTQSVAKPAVPFGAKYRIIDFPLSNCVNSGIDTVGVLTQYQPFVLNEYIGNGQPWDLDRIHGGVHVLPPYQSASGADWYSGTANAIYQNIHRTRSAENADAHKQLLQSGDVSVRNRKAVHCGEADVAQGMRDDGRDHGVELVHGHAVLLENGLENLADGTYGGRLGDVADDGNGLNDLLPLCISHRDAFVRVIHFLFSMF